MLPLNRDASRRIVAGVDWGFVHPGALEVFAIDGDGRMLRIWEVYYSQKTIDWWVERAQEIHVFYRVEAFVCDPSEPAYITAFQRAGLPAMAGYNGVAPGIQAVAQRLVVQADGRPRLMFLRDQSYGPDPELRAKKLPMGFEDEVLSYVWDTRPNWKKGEERKKGEDPLKESDHSADAVRYACCYIDQVGQSRYAPVSPLAPAFEPRRLW